MLSFYLYSKAAKVRIAFLTVKCEIHPATLSVELRSNPVTAPNHETAVKESVYSQLNWKQHLHFDCADWITAHPESYIDFFLIGKSLHGILMEYL